MTRPEDVGYRVRVTTFTLLRLGLAAAVLLALLIGPALLVDSGWAILLGMGLFTVALFSMSTARPLPLYPAHSFGVERRVDEDTFDGPRKHCAECGRGTTQGLKRRYARQFVLLGVPLHTLEWGVNHYCLDCADPGGGPGVDPAASNDRVYDEDGSAKRELERAFDEE